jgi:dienelactone hydrolase
MAFFVTQFAFAKVVKEEFEYKDGKAKLKGFIAYDDSIKGKRPGVIVVHEWWGHNEYARKRATMLAKLGYTAIALDMYGDGKLAKHPKDAKKFSGEIFANMDLMKSRFNAALTKLKKHKTVNDKKIAAVGYCFGGAVVLHMARSGIDLKGIVSIHGHLKTKAPAKAGQIKAKILVIHGMADPVIPAKDVEAFKNEMKVAKVDMTFKAYKDAKHAFTNPGATEVGKKFKLPIAYNEQADKQSWEDMKKFLKDVLK